YLGTRTTGSNAGRMNAKGQPAFYGATSAKIALAEVRPPVGSKVAIASFHIERPLILLDLRRLDKISVNPCSSLFDPLTLQACQRRDFLKTLCKSMLAPAMPDTEDKNYLVTQVIADYLVMHPTTPID